MRTQVILPKRLRDEIEEARRKHGETLAEYLRRAARERIDREEKKKTDLARLAESVVGAVKESSWDDVDVSAWQREMRSDRTSST